jgi:hypothetical protein
MKADLIVLVPDKDIEQTVGGLLCRHKSIGIHSLAGASIIVHPGRDPGIFKTGHALLEPYIAEARYALIVFDRAWEGAPTDNALALAAHVESTCQPVWGNRARCVCVDPEIEGWIWSDSPHVPTALGWENRTEMVDWLANRGLWPQGCIKPPDPKAAFEEATRYKKVVPSSSIFEELARKVSLRRCRDPSFLALVEILRGWFPTDST